MTLAAPTAASTQVAANQANLDAGKKNLDSGYSTFLNLLTTQLKNQDPTSPLDTNAFTQQLVQMTGVQQQLLTNQLLQQLVSGSSGGSGVAGAVGLIGKTVTVDTAETTLSGGQAAWRYALAGNASAGALSIADANGRVVWSGPASDLGAGEHAFSWNGRDSSGRQLPDGGRYTLSVAAADASGGSVAATVAIRGQVTGVSQASGQTVVNIGGAQAPLSKVVSVAAQ